LLRQYKWALSAHCARHFSRRRAGHLGCPPDRSIVVPTVAWNEAFRKVPQLLDQPRGSNKPKTVEVALEGTKVRLSFHERNFTCDQIDGRFPDWTQVLPKCGPAFTIYVNPDLLVDILTAVKQMIGESDKVTLAFWSDTEPLAVVAKSAESGLCIDGLVMPLTPSPSQIQKEKDERAARIAEEEESEPEAEEGSNEEPEAEEVDA
jgi:DNA polymerase III sliding clamp (beta) subunit (PCNA family)